MQRKHTRLPNLFVALAVVACLAFAWLARPASGSAAPVPALAPSVVHFELGDSPAFLCPSVVTDPGVCPGDGAGNLDNFLNNMTFIDYHAPWGCLSIDPSLNPDGTGTAPYPVFRKTFVVITPGNGEFLVDFNISPATENSNHRMDAVFTVPDTALELTGPDSWILHAHQDALPLVWIKGPDKGDTFGYISIGDIVYEAPTPPDPPTSMSVSSIEVSKVNESGGQRRGRAVVTIVDNNGDPVSGADVDGTFTGDVTGTVFDATTGADGKATLESVTTNSGNIHFTFCVDDVTIVGLIYDDVSNVETCDSL